MDVIIVCHVEFGRVEKKVLIFDKKDAKGVSAGVPNLIKLAEKYKAKITFAVMPEVVDFFPKIENHEIALHLHPGKEEFGTGKAKWIVGDSYIYEKCSQLNNSTVLSGHSYYDQLEMIKIGKDYLKEKLGKDTKVFVAGRWSENSDTIKALQENGFTHDCSALPGLKTKYADWSLLKRICAPYYPAVDNYQKKGNSSVLMMPVARTPLKGTVCPEDAIRYGFKWLRACFSEYYSQGVPIFHIALHSPAMTDDYYITIMDRLLSFISQHKDINFKFASEIVEYENKKFSTKIFPYLFSLNKTIFITVFRKIISVFK